MAPTMSSLILSVTFCHQYSIKKVLRICNLFAIEISTYLTNGRDTRFLPTVSLINQFFVLIFSLVLIRTQFQNFFYNVTLHTLHEVHHECLFL